MSIACHAGEADTAVETCENRQNLIENNRGLLLTCQQTYTTELYLYLNAMAGKSLPKREQETFARGRNGHRW